MNALTKWFNYLSNASPGDVPFYGGTGRSDPLKTVKDIYSIENAKKSLELKAIQSVAAQQTIFARQQQMQKTVLDEQRAQRKEESDKFDSVMSTFTNLMTDTNVSKGTKDHLRLQMNEMMVGANREDFVRLSALTKTILKNNTDKKSEEWVSMRGPRPQDLADGSGRVQTVEDDLTGVATNKFLQMEYDRGKENYILGKDNARPMPRMVKAGNMMVGSGEQAKTAGVYSYRDEMTGQINVMGTEDLPSGVLSSFVEAGGSISEFIRTGQIRLGNAAPSNVTIGNTMYNSSPVFDVEKGWHLDMHPIGPSPASQTKGSTSWTPPPVPPRGSKIITALNSVQDPKMEKYTNEIGKTLKADEGWFDKLTAVSKVKSLTDNPDLNTEKGGAVLGMQILWKDSMGGGVVPYIKPGTAEKQDPWSNLFRAEKNEIYHYEGGQWAFLPADSYSSITIGDRQQVLWYKHNYRDEEHYWTDHNGVPRMDLFGIPPGVGISQEQYEANKKLRNVVTEGK